MDDEKEELILERLRKLQEKTPSNFKLMKMGVNATFTPEEALEEVEKGSKMGDAIMKSEETMLDYVLEMEKRAGL